ncbi:hypothetical protein D0Y65_051411 [Glycine soja]|uniref:DET1- and DDB1-associated protein 1 domain-containing protein n=1 Tax=Glycine soja TaxID=3848 RepID=A0A445FG96_GLYSO|nr:hypothetical protein D0Y65_051411 [Glycine soja]RZB47831.1 hypothetical protein D0Y65_051411 [Glycine soja]
MPLLLFSNLVSPTSIRWFIQPTVDLQFVGFSVLFMSHKCKWERRMGFGVSLDKWCGVVSYHSMDSLLGNWPSFDPHNFSQLRPSDPSSSSRMTLPTYHPTHSRTLPAPDQVLLENCSNSDKYRSQKYPRETHLSTC